MPDKADSLRTIVSRLGYPASDTLRSLWDTMVNEREAAWIASLPGTAADVARRTGDATQDVVRGLQDLYQRGLVLLGPEEGGEQRYSPHENAGVLMDLVLFDRRHLAYGPDLEMWRRFYNEELVHEHDYPSVEERPFRVVPVMETVPDDRAALPYERVVDLIRGAQRISVEHCPCRTREQRCDNPTETCLALDGVAEYMIERGVGRAIGADEALAILADAEARGLMHLVENTDSPRVICNCCPCCCVFLRAITAHGMEHVVASSRYRAAIDRALCARCGTCVGRCPLHSITIGEQCACVDEQRCLGCGLCATACPAGAIRLVPVDNISPVPHRVSGFETLLAPGQRP